MRLAELEEWLTVGDAADRLGISRQGVHNLLNDMKLGRAVKTRLGWLIEPASVERVAKYRAENPPKAGRPRKEQHE